MLFMSYAQTMTKIQNAKISQFFVRWRVLIFVLSFAITSHGQEDRHESLLSSSQDNNTPKARPACENQLSNLFSVSAEVEMRSDLEVIRLLTTENGLVSGLFPQKILDNHLALVQEELKTLFGDEVSLETRWDDVFVLDQSKVILVATRLRMKYLGVTHSQDRKVFGLKIKNHVTLNPTQIQTAKQLGVELDDNGNLSLALFLEYVEYGNPAAMEDFSVVEIHARSNSMSADELANKVWDYQRVLGIPISGLHIHTVGKLPRKVLNSEGAGAIMALATARLNMMAEIIWLESGRPIKQIKNAQRTTFFAPLDGYELNRYANLVNGQKSKLDDPRSLKTIPMAFVIPRAKKYDERGLMGYENRIVNANLNSNDMLILTREIEAYVGGQHYEREDNLIRLLKSKKSRIQFGVFQWHYNSLPILNTDVIVKNRLRTMFKDPLPPYVQDYFDIRTHTTVGIKALFYDWMHNPFIWLASQSDHSMLENISNAQKLAISKIVQKLLSMGWSYQFYLQQHHAQQIEQFETEALAEFYATSGIKAAYFNF